MQGNNSYETHAALSAANRSPYLVWLIWILWLPFFIPPLVNLLQSHPALPHLIMVLVEVALFIAIYLWATWQTTSRLVKAVVSTRRIQTSIWLISAVLTLLSFTLALSGQANQWIGPFIFTSGYAGGSLRTVRASIAVVALALLLVVLGGFLKLNWLDLLQGGVFIIAVGFIVMFVVRAVKTSWELRAAREEIARLAVTSERLRIARDLHDLLGHNLSLITLKSELAGKLVHVAPDRAANEISDVEQVARTTLQEVREAVASYRQPTLLNELHGAQEILSAANIGYRFNGGDIAHLPPEIEAVLAWAVREGVTNVIRHTKAQHCTISLKQEKSSVSLEITNDGVNMLNQLHESVEPSTGNRGNGLRGLAERVEELGGTFESGPRSNNNFRLLVMIPLTQSIATHRTASPTFIRATSPKDEKIDTKVERRQR